VEFTPIIVLTGLDDRNVGIEAIQHGAEDYLVKDEVSGELLVHSIQYAIEQARQEAERVRYRKQLESLNDLNTISHEITHDVITTNSRDSLEQAVCERIIESDEYLHAWIGDLNRPTEQISPRASAGGESEMIELTIAADDEGTEDRPEARAIETQQTQISEELQIGQGLDTDQTGACDPRSVAAIPITYRTIFYGILVIHARSPNAFSSHETEILSRLGEVIGHAITSIERKNALVSDSVLHLGFRVAGVCEELVALSADGTCTLRLENFIRSDNGILVYGHADGLRREDLHDVAAQSADIDDLRVLSAGADSYDFEFTTTALESLVTAVADHGGRVASGTIDSGELRLTVEFPQGRDKRQLAQLVEDNCAGATLYSHRTVEQDDPSIPETRSVFRNRLTEKQRAALETAYRSGYFDWPRTTSGEEIAALLGITQATFSEHFRAAEREFFDVVFENKDTETPPPSPWKQSESGTNSG
jgi:predicted DNA binding protein